VLREAGLGDVDFDVAAVAPANIPAELARAHLGLSFRKPTFSQIAASPTKIPEYLAVGLPVVVNAGIGDSDQLIESARVGVVVPDFAPKTLASAAAQALALAADPELPARATHAAREEFDLSRVGGARYRRVYERLGAYPTATVRVQEQS
jgi:hypothetical protein